MGDVIQKELLFDDKEVLEGYIIFFFFQCKVCGEQWFSTFCQCPRCKRLQKYKILDTQAAMEYQYQQMLEDKIHFVFLAGGE